MLVIAGCPESQLEENILTSKEGGAIEAKTIAIGRGHVRWGLRMIHLDQCSQRGKGWRRD